MLVWPHNFVLGASRLRRETSINKECRSLKRRCLQMPVDTDHRNGPKATRSYPRKKNDQPPQPPKIKLAKPAEIRKAKELAFKFLLL